MQLLGGGSCRHREVQAVHERGAPERREAKNRRFRFAGAGFTFKNQKRTFEWGRGHDALQRSGLVVIEQRLEVVCGGRCRPVASPKALALDGIVCDTARPVDISHIIVRFEFE